MGKSVVQPMSLTTPMTKTGQGKDFNFETTIKEDEEENNSFGGLSSRESKSSKSKSEQKKSEKSEESEEADEEFLPFD